MRRKLLHISFVCVVIFTAGCVKETYDMKKLSKQAHFSPTLAISAIKGDISLSDIVKSGDTVVFDQDKFVRIIFKVDTLFDFTLADFITLKKSGESTGMEQPESAPSNPPIDFPALSPGQLAATIEPDTINFDIDEILDHITGTFGITNPIVTISYTNPFMAPVALELNVKGNNRDKSVNLNLSPFSLLHPVNLTDPPVTGTFKIDKTNSSLPELISLPPEKIYFSGQAIMNTTGKGIQDDNYLLANSRLTGSLEVEVPLEFRMNNLQFTDTVDNFLKADSDDKLIDPANFKFLRVIVSAKNGFPLGASVKMSLYDSATKTVKNTANADGLLDPAPVDSNGKVTGISETSITIEFTKEFFNSVDKADKLIFRFTLNTTGNGSKDVKIYSDYSIDFNAALVVKPDINLN